MANFGVGCCRIFVVQATWTPIPFVLLRSKVGQFLRASRAGAPCESRRSGHRPIFTPKIQNVVGMVGVIPRSQSVLQLLRNVHSIPLASPCYGHLLFPGKVICRSAGDRFQAR